MRVHSFGCQAVDMTAGTRRLRIEESKNVGLAMTEDCTRPCDTAMIYPVQGVPAYTRSRQGKGRGQAAQRTGLHPKPRKGRPRPGQAAELNK